MEWVLKRPPASTTSDGAGCAAHSPGITTVLVVVYGYVVTCGDPCAWGELCLSVRCLIYC
jgi:hypothetical protein